MKPRRNPRKKPAIPVRKQLARTRPSSAPLAVDQVLSARELFWQNVIREMLASLAATPNPSGPKKTPTESSPEVEPNLFDGRLAVITRNGERIPIAAVLPLFGCGVNTPSSARDLSMAIECTIFQIRTPEGHVITIPIHEIRSFHAVAPELMERLERSARRRAARREAQSEDDEPPFGFAAFTSTARGLPSLPLEPPSQHPME